MLCFAERWLFYSFVSEIFLFRPSQKTCSLLQISTINLGLMRTTFISETALAANMGLFVLTFFAYRIVICPYLWWGIFITSWENRDNPISQACLPWHFKYVTFIFGMFFNCLNSFWFYKILRKLRRKLSGKEKVKERNSFKDE